MSNQIGTVVAAGERWATLTRSTRETQITVTLKLDGTGETTIDTGVGFYDHLLNSMAYHGLFDLEIAAAGDLVVDEHHTVEDVAWFWARRWPRRSATVRASPASGPRGSDGRVSGHCRRRRRRPPLCRGGLAVQG